jgi:hypothetical protein
MRARLLVIAAVTAAGCRSSARRAPAPAPAAPDAGTAAAAPPAPIATCERYVQALAEAAAGDRLSLPVAALLRNEHDLLAVALRAPVADRPDLTLRCATGLVRLARVIDADADADLAANPYRLGTLAAIPAPVPADLDAGAPPPPRAPPPPPAAPPDAPPAAPPDANLGTTGMTPACARLIAIFDRMATCPALPTDMKDTLRQSRDLMRDSYSHIPRHMRASVDESCRSAVRAYDQVLSQFRCP